MMAPAKLTTCNLYNLNTNKLSALSYITVNNAQFCSTQQGNFMSTLFLATSIMMHLLFFWYFKTFLLRCCTQVDSFSSQASFPDNSLIFAKFPDNNRFLPRNAMLSAVYAVVVRLCVCLCVCHSPVLYQNG